MKVRVREGKDKDKSKGEDGVEETGSETEQRTGSADC